ncbi:VTT domain-containing protein, partial [Streptomyces sp. NPDC046557]|uniref:DedA family protein n=1 Tax=Streptomyces sp. NPDC046557 TaxID=3155372 RepID=UPI0033C6EC16
MTASAHSAADLGVNLLHAHSLLATFGVVGIAVVLFAETGLLVGRAGGALLERSRSQRLHEGAERAEEFLAKYGHAKAIVPARFVPVVRTVLNPLAGALNVPARVFTLWQVL